MAKTKARPRRQERNSNYSSIAKKRIKPKCNFEGGCTNIIAVNGGVCKTHGGANNVTKKKKCTFENMYQWSRQGWSMYHAWRTRKAVQSSDAETRDVPRVLLRVEYVGHTARMQRWRRNVNVAPSRNVPNMLKREKFVGRMVLKWI